LVFQVTLLLIDLPVIVFYEMVLSFFALLIYYMVFVIFVIFIFPEVTILAYQIIRVAGYKNAAKGQRGFGGIQIHDQREKDVSHTNQDIDWSRVHLNYDLHNGNNKINFAEKINERISSLDLKKALRKDANVMAQIFISASPEWFKVVDENSKDENGKGKVLYEIDPEVQRRYFTDAYKWVCSRYGTENIISATVHLDEATPHMHINLVPVANGKVCYADLFTEKPQKSRGRNGKQLTALHDDFYKHNQESGHNLERGELQNVTGKKEHLSVLDFKKQEREKEVRELDQKSKKLIQEIKNSEAEIQDLETLKTQTAINVSELRFFASELQADVNDLKKEKTHLNTLKNDLKQQIKTEKDILKNLEGKIKTRKGIDQIRERTSKTLLGDALKISQEDFDSLIKTSLASPITKTTEENKSLTTKNNTLTEENKTLKSEIKILNETFTEKISQTESQLESSERKLERAYRTIKIKDEEIDDLNEQLTSQTKRADHWVTQARTYEANYNRVLKERNALKGLNKSHDHDLD